MFPNPNLKPSPLDKVNLLMAWLVHKRDISQAGYYEKDETGVETRYDTPEEARAAYTRYYNKHYAGKQGYVTPEKWRARIEIPDEWESGDIQPMSLNDYTWRFLDTSEFISLYNEIGAYFALQISGQSSKMSITANKNGQHIIMTVPFKTETYYRVIPALVYIPLILFHADPKYLSDILNLIREIEPQSNIMHGYSNEN